jgi:hypothetical protein
LLFPHRLVIAPIQGQKIFPTRLVSQSNPSSNSLFNRVAAYVSQQPPLRLHLAWLDARSRILAGWMRYTQGQVLRFREKPKPHGLIGASSSSPTVACSITSAAWRASSNGNL